LHRARRDDASALGAPGCDGGRGPGTDRFPACRGYRTRNPSPHRRGAGSTPEPRRSACDAGQGGGRMNERAAEAPFSTELCRLVGVRHPVVQTGMGWVAGPRLVSATAEAGGLGVLAAATMRTDELRTALDEVRQRTAQPF